MFKIIKQNDKKYSLIDQILNLLFENYQFKSQTSELLKIYMVINFRGHEIS